MLIRRVAVSAKRWNRDGEVDNFAMRRLSSAVSHARRFRSLMTRRSQSWTATVQVSQRASPIQPAADRASAAKPNRSLKAAVGSTDSHSILTAGVAGTTDISTR